MSLTIGGTSFRLPNRVERIRLEKPYSTKRSANNTLITSVFNFDTKKIYFFEYDILTDAEFTTLEGKNHTSVAVVLTDTGYAINDTFFLEFDSYGWRYNQKKKLTLKLTEV